MAVGGWAGWKIRLPEGKRRQHDALTASLTPILPAPPTCRQVMGVYQGRSWRSIEEHINDILGKQQRETAASAASPLAMQVGEVWGVQHDRWEKCGGQQHLGG